MFSSTYQIVVVVCLLIILSYGFTIISNRTKIPSVLMLLATGIIARIVIEYNGFEIPDLKTELGFFGIVGVILIVLEGALELKIKRSKLKLIRKSFGSALVALLAMSFAFALIIQLIINESFQICLVNAIPFAVISSAIAIPSVIGFTEDKKEFIIYESTFSDIIGIMLFNIVLANSTFSWHMAQVLAFDLVIVIVISIILSVAIMFFIAKSKMNIKFFLLIAVLGLLYAGGEIYEFSSLLLILIFGLVINNLDLIWKDRMKKYIDLENLRTGIKLFHIIITESAFLIRTLFFVVFGLTLQLIMLFNLKVLLMGTIICLVLYGIRYLYLKYVTRLPIFPNIMIAPRGLITVSLYYSIPKGFSIGEIISEGVLFFVILVTSVVMMIGLIKAGKPVDLEEALDDDEELDPVLSLEKEIANEGEKGGSLE